MKLFELFKDHYEYRWTTQSNSLWRGKFELADGGRVFFECSKSAIYKKIDGEVQTVEAWDVDFSRNSSKKITNEGDAFRIFATVGIMLEEFELLQEPNIIRIQADYDDDNYSRSKLYSRMLTKFAKANGFSLIEKPRAQSTMFSLERI